MKKIVLFVITSILFTVVLLSVKNSYSAFTKNVQTSLEVTTPKLEAVFLPGAEFNSKIKQISGTSGANSTTDNTNITSIVRSNVLTITPTIDNIVSTSSSSFPIYAWFSNGVLYYYTEVENPYMNQISDSMFKNIENVVDIDISSIDMSNVTSTTNMFDNCSVKELKTPKVYPNNTNVTITLGKNMYDENDVSYAILGRSTNPTSITETWIKEGYVVSFDANGGSVNIANKIVRYDENYGNLPTPIRSGYTFLGWYSPDVDSANFIGPLSDSQTVRTSPYSSWSTTGEEKFEVGNILDFDITVEGANITDADLNDKNIIDYYTITNSNNIRGRINITSALQNGNNNKYYHFIDINCNVFPTNTIVNKYNFVKFNNLITSTSSAPMKDITLYAKFVTELINNKVDYSYTGSTQEFIAPQAGTYKVELWGAQGGGRTSGHQYGGFGAYSVGTISLNENELLYINVGDKGGDASLITGGSGGYNGGAAGGNAYRSDLYGGGGGGGASSIALSTGTLYHLGQINKKNNVIIVAGGGGGSGNETTWGHAGGKQSSTVYSMSNGTVLSSPYIVPATQSSGYAFGLGQDGRNSTESNCSNCGEGSGGGGGGYYGGYASINNGNGTAIAGTGGSGYIGNANLANKSMYCYDCEEDLINENTFTVSTTGTSGYKNTVSCPDGYSSSPVSKCAKSGQGYVRITLVTPGESWDYAYSGGSRSFTVPTSGAYKVELWGASGSGSGISPGLGGYVSGNIYLTKNENLYVYVGETGDFGPGYNGGGGGESAGGGATDVRISTGNWDNFTSLKSRIMVAGGGGGGILNETSQIVGNAGGLSGYDTLTVNHSQFNGKGATQTSGGSGGQDYCESSWGYECIFDNKNGLFGKGGSTTITGTASESGNYFDNAYRSSGGGGGYYGGGGGVHPGGNWTGGGGGSSFISGYTGCNAISNTSIENNIVHTNQPNHYSGKVFINGVMIDGKGCNWSSGSAGNCGANQIQPDGSYATGHYGNGYARITLIAEGESWNFSYNGTDGTDGSAQEFTAPFSGTYKLETWGAQGGNNYDTKNHVDEPLDPAYGGYGGYSTGEMHISKNEKIYIIVGAQGVTTYNDPSVEPNIEVYAYPNGGAVRSNNENYKISYNGGGGSTHIAKQNKLISELDPNSTNLLMVAAGGGGVSNWWKIYSDGGSGGGYIGGSTTSNYNGNNPTGGTQNSGGLGGGNSTSTYNGVYGIGGGSNFVGNNNVSGGGGGGFYGGGASWGGSGAGGSSYIGNTSLTNKSMYCYNCQESLSNSTQEQKNTFTVSTTGSSAYKDTTACPSGYSSSAISKCAKAGNGYARITLVSLD